jgi:hypothetical protein
MTSSVVRPPRITRGAGWTRTSDDRLFPAKLLRRVVKERLGITPDEIDGGHCIALSRPRELAERLVAYAEEA